MLQRNTCVASFLILFWITSGAQILPVEIPPSGSGRVDDGLIVYYPFNGDEAMADQSGFGTPLDLSVEGAVERLNNCNGVVLKQAGKLYSPEARKIGEAIVNSGEFTFEIWAKAANNTQLSLGNLLNYAEKPAQRNFALGPNRTNMILSLRTTAGNMNGSPHAFQPAVITTEVQHWVATSAGGMLRLFLDGQLVLEEERAGGLENWDLSHGLFIGADGSGQRYWEGEVYLVAAYGRAITEAEVLQNYGAGDNPGIGGVPNPVNQAPQVACAGNHTVILPANSVHIEGVVEDDGLPSGNLSYEWRKVTGPGTVAFNPPSQATTTASFSKAGEYVVRLTASDGLLEGSDEVSVLVTEAVDSARVSRDLIAFYPFNEGDGSVARDQSGHGAPLDLAFEGNAGWLNGRYGVVLEEGSKLESQAAVKLHQALTASNAFTFEIWAKPADLRQWGPARLVSCSWDPYLRNFSLGQHSAKAEVRLRTTKGDENGWPYLKQEDAISDGVEHYAVTLADGLLSFYRNGQLIKAEPRAGDLSNWEPTYPLLVGNERTGDRSWRGEVYLLAVYERALSGAEVNRNFQVGDDLAGGGNPVVNQPPEVNSGGDRTVLLPASAVQLDGAVTDDGLPIDNISLEWSKVSGPGDVSFSTPGQVSTMASFSAEGEYVLKMTANDGALPGSDNVTVTVASSARVSLDLIAFYPLNEGEGRFARDQSGFQQPLDMEMNEKTNWLPGRNGVLFDKEGSLMSAAAGKVHQAITASGEFSFEVWAKAGNLTQGGPARLVTYSADSSYRNFMLGQQEEGAEVRLRTSQSESGWPYMKQAGVFSVNLEHYLVTYSNSQLSLYRNGQLIAAEMWEGDLSNWDSTYPLLIGNERTDWRSWRGEVYMMAVYSRALGAAEVHRNFQVGDNLAGGGSSVANQPPAADAGEDQLITLPNLSTSLAGGAADDGLPGVGLTTTWTLISGPGTASFDDPNSLHTTVSFSEAGQYQLQLTANDGALTTDDPVTVSISETARVSRGLIAFYPLTETSGTVAHDQSNHAPPLDLQITGEVSWLSGQNGVLLGHKGKLESAVASKLHQGITGSNAFTFEVWAKAANTTQGGPARIVSYSLDPYQRNVTLGQQETRAEVRLRTTASDDNGKPYLRVEDAISTLLEHYAVTYDGRTLRIFRNGALIGEEFREGDLSNWDPSHVFLLGNEHGRSRRDWYGELHLAAVYDRALSAPEVMRNYIVGENIQQGGMPVPNMPPLVSGGNDKTTTLPKDTITLGGSAIDDGLPIDTLTVAWTRLTGPAPVEFSNAAALNSSARFTAEGDYLLRLTVGDGEHTLTDDVAVAVIAAYVPRLLDQATWGPTPESVELLRQIGPEQFLQQQFNAIPSTYPDVSESSRSVSYLQNRFFTNAVNGEDQLRQRMSFALGQILVVSANTVGKAQAMTSYVRILDQHALGNYHDLLRDVTFSPTMGKFLDMVNNAKVEEDGSSPPNENYGRELLQLLAVGLNKLNQDGTPMLDPAGQPIPAYTEETVSHLTRALTGWTYPTQPGRELRWPNREYFVGPMIPVEEMHDTSEKILLDGFRIPPGQTARQDLEMALRNVFEHPNVGPFVCKQLIQHLVTSNPSPAYVGRVAAAFNDNGAGVRGDMKAVARAMLLDPEAAQALPHGGHLREPVLFSVALLRGLGAEVTDENRLRYYTAAMGQNLFYPPSVFNYFSQFFRIPDLGLLGPEFQIHTASRAIDRADFVYAAARDRLYDGVVVDLSQLEALADDPDQLVDAVDMALFQGRMSPQLRQAILTALEATDRTETRVQSAIYIAATSSEYQVQH